MFDWHPKICPKYQTLDLNYSISNWNWKKRNSDFPFEIEKISNEIEKISNEIEKISNEIKKIPFENKKTTNNN